MRTFLEVEWVRLEQAAQDMPHLQFVWQHHRVPPLLRDRRERRNRRVTSFHPSLELVERAVKLRPPFLWLVEARV